MDEPWQPENLLYCVLAVQNGFLSWDDVVGIIQANPVAQRQSIGELLVREQKLTADEHQRLHCGAVLFNTLTRRPDTR